MVHKSFKINSLIFFFLFTNTLAYASSPHNAVLTSFGFLTDNKSQLSFKDIRTQNYSKKFKKNQNGSFKFGIIDYPVWIRARIPEIKPGSMRPVLIIDSPGIKKANLFLPIKSDSGIIYKKFTGGLTKNLSKIDWGYRFMAYDMPDRIVTGQWLYLRFNTLGHTANFTVTLTSPASLRKMSWYETSYLSLIIGILIAMILYNASLYIFLRDNTYLLYVIYILSMCAYQVCHGGIGRIAGFPELINYSIPVSAMTYILALAFAQKFLNTKETLKKIHYSVYVLMALSAIALILALTGHVGLANHFTHILGVLSPLLMIIIGVMRIRQGFLPARYYLAAWGILCFSIIILVLVGLKILPYNFVTYNAHAMGSALESILLSMALGDKVRMIQQERRKLKEEERRLSELSIKDELTGLYNKRGYAAKLPYEMKFAKNNRTSLSLIVLDVDHFKSFNDTYGHALGDRVLSRIGDVIIQSIRGKDIPCRYGGEEFAILLPESTHKEAEMVAERIRQNIENQKIEQNDGEMLSCTISVGVTTMQQGDSNSSLFERADEALYRAKRNGRNRVETA